jgi:hypothetical protein
LLEFFPRGTADTDDLVDHLGGWLVWLRRHGWLGFVEDFVHNGSLEDDQALSGEGPMRACGELPQECD